MPKVEIHAYSDDDTEWGPSEATAVYVDGTLVGMGTYGGEPEDNSANRDYAWVDGLLQTLAKALGADVTFKFIEADPEIIPNTLEA